MQMRSAMRSPRLAKPPSRSVRCGRGDQAARSADRPEAGARARTGPRPIMADRARVAVLISGRGSNMAALLYAAKAGDCPYEVAVVISDKPAAPGLRIATAEDVP